MKFIRELPDASCIREEYSLTEEETSKKNRRIEELKDILSGKEKIRRFGLSVLSESLINPNLFRILA